MFKSIPGTSEYQRKLAKAVKPGKQFKLTNGGGPTNSDDYFIGLELQYWDEEAAKLSKVKDAVYSHRKLIEKAKKMTKKRSLQKWTMEMLKANIRAKDSSVTTTSFNGVSRVELVEMWEKEVF